ncbi:MAG: hypothetical protein QF701_07470, partial [Nitrospinota bacterium]|nr:hypothetical protein [Nitrospinota bacterium]
SGPLLLIPGGTLLCRPAGTILDCPLHLRKGDPLGERLSKIAGEQDILLMMCDQCALERGLATGQPGNCEVSGTVDNVIVGCFPDLYDALSDNPPDQVITL